MLTAPVEREELIVYLVATKETVSAVLMTEIEAKEMPIYFVTKALRGVIKTESSREAIEVEHRIRRICNTLQTQSISQGEDISRIHSRTTRRGLFGYSDRNRRRTPRTMDLIYRRIILHRWFWGKANTHKPRRDGIYLCPKIQIEVKPVATNTGNQVKKFTWDNIVCRFGLPGEIISDNGKQFRDNPFKYWCEKLCIRQHFASVKHPQTNGLVERINRSLREGIKARLDAGSKNWMEELSHVLWAHHTMIKSSNEDIPFSLTYGTEAVILVEIGMPTLRTVEVDLIQNNEALEINLDVLEERREQDAIRQAKSKAKMERYYVTPLFVKKTLCHNHGVSSKHSQEGIKS
nr:reverse transcriptase domain-containing protein [Tanacetum cinerariifolium]